VFGFDEEENSNTIPYQHITKSKINLYQKRQTGSRTQDYKKIVHCKNLRVDNNKYDVMYVGIVCDKLKLPDFVAEQCWRLYLKLRDSQPKFTRAKSACLAIYQICRQNKIPFSEESVRYVVCQSFGVKNAPSLKSVIFKVKTSDITREEDNSANMPQDQFNAKKQYYLNQYLSQAQKRNNLADMNVLRSLAFQYYYDYIKRHGNRNFVDCNMLAKKSVSLAVQRCITPS